jgi:hypothetical protein
MNRVEKGMRNWSGFGYWLIGFAALGVGAGLLLLSARADDVAQPSRAARLSSVDGRVLISQGTELVTDQAVANAPLFEGMRVATAEDGRAEIQLEDGSVARLSPNSSLTLTVLRGQGEAGAVEMVMGSGLGYFEVQGAGQAGAIRIRFGDSVVTAGGFTVMRINLDNSPGELAVFSGNAHLERGKDLTVDLHGGESLALSGADATRYDLAETIDPDSWDTWNSDRDQMLSSEAASKTDATKGFADSSNPAWNDLDANGSWYNVPGQGNVWSPYAASGAGWDPYGSGYWMWTPRYGYIWVSSYSWGYLPFQCGNWNYYDSFGWGWMPGMGGCSPWWNSGYVGPNIGSGYGGYRPPIPPHLRPRPPIGRGGHFGPMPVLAVNRRPSAEGRSLPARDGRSAVVIAGQTVQPARPLIPRPQFEHSGSAFVNRTTYPGPRTVGGPPGATEPSFGFGRMNGSSNSANYPVPRTAGGANQNGSAASHGSYSGGNAGGGSPGHSSGGGGYSGGGSASHSSSGGGNSGGGSASHSSSGGGGGYSGGGGGGGHAGGGGYSGGGGGGGGHAGGGGASSGGGAHK